MSIKKHILLPVCLLAGLTEVFAQNVENTQDSVSVLEQMYQAQEVGRNTPFGQITHTQDVSSTSVITGEELRSYTDMNLSNALQGRLLGLQVISNAGTPGSGTASITVRGKSRNDNNSPLVLVDGIERDWVTLNAEEVETITVLKDAPSKILYGLRAANGVILIETRRGLKDGFKVEVGYEQGIKTPTSDPSFLSADAYAQQYNQARINDGLAPLYSEAQIQGYKNGLDPILFPNVDFYDYTLNDYTDYKKAFANFIGGTKKSSYFVHLGYAGEGGLEKFGNKTTYDRINMRANLDINLTDWATVVADISGRIEFRGAPNLSSESFFNLLSTTRANEYPIFIQETGERDTNILGGSLFQPKNIYGEMVYGGYDKRVDRDLQTRFGFDFDFDQYVKGLKANVYASLDASNKFEYGKDEGYNTYSVLGTSETGYDLLQVQQGLKADDQIRKSNADFSATTLYGNIAYARTFAEKHQLNATAISYLQTSSTSSNTAYSKSLHAGLNANYVYNKRYVVDASIVTSGTNKLAAGERFTTSTAVGLGWIASNEDFLKDNEVITYLKLKGSWGILSYDPAYWTYPHLQRFSEAENPVKFGDSNNNMFEVWSPSRQENLDLAYERAHEFNIGAELDILHDFSLEINYFNNARKGMHTNYADIYPDYYGQTGAFFNHNIVLSTGLELGVNYQKVFGEVKLDVGANVMYQEAAWDKFVQVDYGIDGLDRTGRLVDAIYGYVSDGIFQSQAEIDAAPKQYTGVVRPGDIRYKDLNNDGRVDMDDRQYLGNTSPTFSYGVQVNVNYKNFNLFVLGSGFAGHDRNNNSAYYQMSGRDNYSELALQAWTPATATTAIYPALTTQQGENNFVTSDFWMESGNFFRLKNVELSYTLPQHLTDKIAGFEPTIFLRGANLFEINASENKDLDPERSHTGITNYPIMRSFTMGISVKI